MLPPGGARGQARTPSHLKLYATFGPRARILFPMLLWSTMTAAAARIAEELPALQTLRQAVEGALEGKQDAVELALVALLARGPPAHRGRAGRRQDHAGARPGQGHRRRAAARAVHERLAAERRPGRQRLRPAPRRVRAPAGPHLRQRPPRRRDQPRQPAHAVGAARGDERGPGLARRADHPAAGPVLRHRHAEPAGLRRHVPAPRVAARSLPAARPHRLSAAADRDAPRARRQHRHRARRPLRARSGAARRRCSARSSA